MKTFILFLLNLLFIVSSICFSIWVITPDWLETHKITTPVLFFLFFIVIVLMIESVFGKDIELWGTGFLFLFSLNAILTLFAVNGTKPELGGTWISIIVAVGTCFVFHALCRMDENEVEDITTNENGSEESKSKVKINNTISFDDEHFEGVLAQLQEEFLYLQEQSSRVSTEKLHEAETLLKDLARIVPHYNEMNVADRGIAEGDIENFFTHAKSVLEDYKNEISKQHLREAQKLIYKHVKEKASF